MGDESSPRPSRHASRRAGLTHWLPAVTWVVVMFVMTSLPRPGQLLGRSLPVGDPTAHTIGFFVLIVLWARLALFVARRFSWRPVAWALVACLGYALIDELHQLLIPGRSFEWADLLSDGLGTAMGAALVVLVGRFGVRASG